jgi:hypothetical protein
VTPLHCLRSSVEKSVGIVRRIQKLEGTKTVEMIRPIMSPVLKDIHLGIDK